MTTILPEERREILRLMLLVRDFEDTLSALVRDGDSVPGMQILSTGQEGTVAAVRPLQKSDVLVSNHRSHAHLLARGTDPRGLMAEIMGKTTGVNRGRSGTLHLIVPEVNALMTSTVVGAGPPMAVGAAFAQQYRGQDAITVVIFGDGAASEGSVHEAMNLAALWQLPLLFICENNHWAGAQPLTVHCAGGSVAARGAGYGMPAETVDGNDPDIVHEATTRLAAEVRRGAGPRLLEVVTYRMHGHGESDPQHYVDASELEMWARRDPIELYIRRLGEEGILTTSAVEGLRADARAAVEAALVFAAESPEPAPEAGVKGVWSEDPPSAQSVGGE